MNRLGGLPILLRVAVSKSPGRPISTCPAPRAPEGLEKNPVYRSIRNKARQLGKRRNSDRRPVVLCIGSSLSSALFENGDTRTQGAVLAALHDTATWDVTERHNRLGDPSRKDHRVSGASRIAAVIVVSIEDKHERFARFHERHAVRRIYENPDARVPLSPRGIEFIRRLDFNKVPYGPQWETWAAPGQRRPKIVVAKQDRTEVGKLMEFSQGKDQELVIAIPAQELSRLLAGKVDAKELFQSYGAQHDFGRIFAQNPRIVGMEWMEAEPLKRRPAQVRFRLSKADPLIDPRKGRS